MVPESTGGAPFRAGQGIVRAVATTFPGTVTPLRGLGFFSESERDVLFGRDQEREELTRLVTSEGFRAGLIYGESGVGKTSLLRAGLIPHLRDHGVVALLCEDVLQPEESFAYSMGIATQQARHDGEQAVAYLTRAVAEAVPGQMYLFIVDEAELALASGDERVIHELGELFARVASRSGGRARFLFSCASERLHLFGNLERRTGSLFPPSSRYELCRFHPDTAAMVLERTLALAGSSADQSVARAVTEELAYTGSVLPADLQLAALAVVELGIVNTSTLKEGGGIRELESAWLRKVASETGDERAALRLMAELAQGAGRGVYAIDIVSARSSVSLEFAQHALGVLETKGLIRQTAVYGGPGEVEVRYSLAHELLAPRVREVAAPARAAARRAYELLGSKASGGDRLSTREWLALKREGIAPSTPDERAVIDRTKRFAIIVGAVAAAVPLLIIIILYVSLSGRYYLDVSGEGSSAHVVVRSGRAGLSAFHWLPPGFGDKVADTGFTRAMIEDEVWNQIRDHDIGGEREGGSYAREALEALEPSLRGLIEYAAAGSETSLERLIQQASNSPEETAALLSDLAPIARGLPAELSFVQGAVSDPSPAVQAAALGLAAQAEERRSGTYGEILARSLAAKEGELRRLALAAVRRLDDKSAQQLYAAALALDPPPEGRRELLDLVSTSNATAAPAATTALSILGQDDATDAAKDRARTMLRRAFASAPSETAAATVDIINDDDVPAADRIMAIEMLLELAPEESYAELAAPAQQALSSQNVEVRAAALRLYSHVAPAEAAGELALMLDNEALPNDLKVAMALSWGEVARAKPKEASVALDKLLDHTSTEVRAAAAEAYGFLGRRSHNDLIKMIKKERYEVAVGAARGLANSIAAGASSSNALYGIHQLWKKKGRAQREATRIYNKIARIKAGAAVSELDRALREDDSSLHPIATEGLCYAAAGGSRRALGELAQAQRSATVSIRRQIVECLIDNPELRKPGLGIALSMADDADSQIRTDAARVLASLAKDEESAKIGKALVKLAKDDNREVRIIAISALADLGAAAPEEAVETLPRAFAEGDETEKLAVLRAARTLGAGELAELASSSASPRVRIAGLETAIATNNSVAAAISSALSDPDPTVRRSALAALGSGQHGLDAGQVDRALAFAMGDRDASLGVLALTTLCATGDLDAVVARLSRMLASPSERDRARAATAALGLARRDAGRAIELLEPLYDDPARDVRAAMLQSLGTAYAMTMKPDELAKRLRASESAPTRRLALTAAFLVLGQNPATAEAASAALESVVSDGPPMGRLIARLGLGLLTSSADGFEFLQRLVP